MKDRMRYVLSREDYEALYWPPDEYPMNTLAAAGELRTRGLDAKASVLDYLVSKGIVTVPVDESGHRQWGKQEIDQAAEHLAGVQCYKPSTWQHVIEDSNPAQDIRALREAAAKAPHLPPDPDYFVRTVMPGAAGLGLYAEVHYRPMIEDENAAWRAKVEQARKEREASHAR